MQTLSFILVAAPLSFIFGLSLGIAAFKSRRVEKALNPILLVMQTMPQYAVLVPAIVLFGVGDHDHQHQKEQLQEPTPHIVA